MTSVVIELCDLTLKRGVYWTPCVEFVNKVHSILCICFESNSRFFQRFLNIDFSIKNLHFCCCYRVDKGFRLNVGLDVRLLFFTHFWPLLKWAVFFEELRSSKHWLKLITIHYSSFSKIHCICLNCWKPYVDCLKESKTQLNLFNKSPSNTNCRSEWLPKFSLVRRILTYH